MQLREEFQSVGCHLLERGKSSLHAIRLIRINFCTDHQFSFVGLVDVHVKRCRNDDLVEKRLQRLGDTCLERVADDLQWDASHLRDAGGPSGCSIQDRTGSHFSSVGKHAADLGVLHPHSGYLGEGVYLDAHAVARTRVAPHYRVVADDSSGWMIQSS